MRWRDRIVGLWDVFVCECEGCECGAEVPGELGGEQADQEVRFDAVVEVVSHRTEG